MTPFDQNGKSRRQSSVKICKLWGLRGMGVVVEVCQLLPLHGSLLKYHSHESNHSRGHKQNMRRPTQPASSTLRCGGPHFPDSSQNVSGVGQIPKLLLSVLIQDPLPARAQHKHTCNKQDRGQHDCQTLSLNTHSRMRFTTDRGQVQTHLQQEWQGLVWSPVSVSKYSQSYTIPYWQGTSTNTLATRSTADHAQQQKHQWLDTHTNIPCWPGSAAETPVASHSNIPCWSGSAAETLVASHSNIPCWSGSAAETPVASLKHSLLVRLSSRNTGGFTLKHSLLVRLSSRNTGGFTLKHSLLVRLSSRNTGGFTQTFLAGQAQQQKHQWLHTHTNIPCWPRSIAETPVAWPSHNNKRERADGDPQAINPWLENKNNNPETQFNRS